MKKLFSLIILLNGFFTFSQDNIEKGSKPSLFEKKHEIKVGAVKLLAGPIFEGTYEYIYSKDFTFGSSILVDFQRQNDWYENFSITPFARFYFQETKEYGAQGFFVEGFGKIATGDDYYIEYYNSDNTYESKKFTVGVIGLSLGKKWINHSGFVFETLIGVGRTLSSSDTAPDAFFRGDLSIGYRF